MTFHPRDTSATRSAMSCDDIDSGKCSIALSTGITMAYVETGPVNGPAVILIHGLTDSLRSWSLTMRALHQSNQQLHILAIDLRGHGGSSMPADTHAAAPEACFRPSDFAADVIAFMQAKGLASATLVGHSLGTFIAQEIVLSHPHLVDRAVLVAAAIKGAGNVALHNVVLNELVEGSWKRTLEARGEVFPAGAFHLTPLDADPDAEQWLASNWVADPTADPAFLAAYVPETARVKLGTWIGATRALLATDNTTRFARWNTPTLVIWATQDAIFLEDPDQFELRQALDAAGRAHGLVHYWKQYGTKALPASGAQADDLGHNVPWAAPEAIAADVAAFIRTGAPTADRTRWDDTQGTGRLVCERGQLDSVRLGAIHQSP